MTILWVRARERRFWLCGLLSVILACPPAVVAASTRASSDDLEQHLAIGRMLLKQGRDAEARSAFDVVLQLDPANREAKQALKQLARRQAVVSRDAGKIAQEIARDRARVIASQVADAERQVKTARERQLKLLYTTGMAHYRERNFDRAIEAFQQMALIDPTHPLVTTGQKMVAQSEIKQAEQRARLQAKLPSASGVANAQLPELERMLRAKQLEQETQLKFAKLALNQQRYDEALELVQRVLALDPQQKRAQQLLQQVQLGKLKQEADGIKRQAEVDDQQMLNDVVKAELITPPSIAATPASLSDVSLTPRSPGLAQPISFDFQDVAFGDVLDFLADSANISIIPSPRLDLEEQRVTLRVEQLPLELALKYLIKNLGLSYRIDEGVVLIAAAEEFENEPMETRVFMLRNGLGPIALEASAVEPSDVLKMDPIKSLIEQSVPQPSGSKLVVDERSGSLIVTNSKENLRKVEELLTQLDVTPLQILIEARFMEVTLTELEHLGFETVLNADYAVDKTKVAGGGRDPSTIIARGGGLKFPAISRESEGANLTLQGVLSAAQFESVLHFLEEKQKSKTLSAPRVTTLNNQTATIKVVEEFRYPTRYEVSLVQFDVNGDGDFDDAGETEFVNVPQDFQKRDIGILLNVTPSVGKDQKSVTLVVAPEVSQFSQFRDLGGGVTVPEFTSSQLATSVVVQDGQTVVLGGLMRDSASDTLTKVPVLGDVPMLRHLFRQREDTQTKRNLLVFITARLLAPRGQTT